MSGLSNLPPGCSSPDGGIDHEFEAAVERLCDNPAMTPQLLDLLGKLAVPIAEALNEAYREGFRDGEDAKEQELDHHDIREAAGHDRVERMLKQKEVADWLGVSPGTIARWVEQGDFPKPVKVTPGTVRWRQSDVERHIEGQNDGQT